MRKIQSQLTVVCTVVCSMLRHGLSGRGPPRSGEPEPQMLLLSCDRLDLDFKVMAKPRQAMRT